MAYFISRNLAKKILLLQQSSVFITSSSSSVPLKWVPPPPFSFSTSSASPSVSSSSFIPEVSSSISSLQPQEKRSGGSRWSKLLLFVPGAITFGLGSWQIFRRQDKIKMLEYRENRLGMEPINCNNIGSSCENMDSLEFRRVVCKGHFDEDKSIFIGPRSRSISGVTENGYYLITPFIPISSTDDESLKSVIVNRGWVPRSWRDNFLKVSQDEAQPHSPSPSSNQESSTSWWRFWSKKPNVTEDQVPNVVPVEVIGVIRGSEKPSIFVPANDSNSCQWFYVDVAEITRACGLPENTLYMEAINDNVNPSNPYPIPKDTNALIRSSVMPQDHLNYTLTWYSLSAAVTFMAFKRLKPKKIRR